MTSLALFERVTKMDKVDLRQTVNRIRLLKILYLGSFPSNHVRTLPNETFAIINTQHSEMQGERWIMIANSCHQLFFADSLGGEMNSFLKQHYKHMTPELLQSHPGVCIFYTIYAAFRHRKFRKEGAAGLHDVNVLSFIS